MDLQIKNQWCQRLGSNGRIVLLPVPLSWHYVYYRHCGKQYVQSIFWIRLRPSCQWSNAIVFKIFALFWISFESQLFLIFTRTWSTIGIVVFPFIPSFNNISVETVDMVYVVFPYVTGWLANEEAPYIHTAIHKCNTIACCWWCWFKRRDTFLSNGNYGY